MLCDRRYTMMVVVNVNLKAGLSIRIREMRPLEPESRRREELVKGHLRGIDRR